MTERPTNAAPPPGPQPETPPGAGSSLLDGLEEHSAVRRRARRRPSRLGAAISAWVAQAWAHPASRALLSASGVMLVASSAIGAWVALRPVPKPDYELGALDTLFNYTLLTDEFNRLPVDERLELIGQLVDRVKGMDGSDSVLMAAFAAQIAGPAREQLVENASRVVVDLMDRSAAAYDPGASRAERVEFLERSTADILRAMSTMSGENADASDEELLDIARREARRDVERFNSGEVGAQDVGQMATVLNMTMGRHTSAEQKLRMGRLGRDMARMLRGQDIDTGQPLANP